ncbi:MAG: caspase family protein [Bacteroidota bacterium]
MQHKAPLNQHIQLPFRLSHAFIVGINAYEHLTPLSTAVNDAQEIAKRLGEQHGFQVHAPLLNASYEELQELLTHVIPQSVDEDDRVLFYFAGHGIALDGEEGPNGYLVAADTRAGEEQTLIPMQQLHDALTKLPCRHGLLILDCCFSGAFKWSSGFRDVVFDLPKIIYEERFWRYCKDPAWQVITSSAHDQKAVDIIVNQSLGLREANGSLHSPFAQSLLRALDGEGDIVPAGNGDGVITVTELYSYLRDSVENSTSKNAKRQSPSIFNLKRHDKGEFIFLVPNHRFNLPPTPNRNPFMGLSSYNEEDTLLFYGRDRVVEALLDKVRQHALVVVSGASGTGKSSVVKAGVLPQLRQQGFTILPIIRPGKEPLPTIATELPDIERDLAKSTCVLFIDQFEELITQCLKSEDRIAFEEQIAKWLHKHQNLRILLSVRSDFEPQFENKILAKWWQVGRYLVPSFSLEEIREVITKPAAQAVLFYEPEELVDQLCEEVSQAPGALPLLSFTLSELYHAYLKSGREDRSLVLADYKKLGGVIGALRTRADAEYAAWGEEDQNSMRKLMLRMISLEGGELAGKRVFTDELQFADKEENARLRTIAKKLVKARLLLQGADVQGRNYIELAHDALVRAWARLWKWINAIGKENLSLQNRLWQAVNDNYIKPVQNQNDQPEIKSGLYQFRQLWDTDARLSQLFQHISISSTHLLKEPGRNIFEDIWPDASVEEQEEWLSRWKEWRVKKQFPDLDSLIVGGLSDKLLALLLFKGQHWLNLAEIDFVGQSWRKRIRDILRLKEERDEAIRDKRKAQASLGLLRARQEEERDRTVAFNIGMASHKLSPSVQSTSYLYRLLGNIQSGFYQKVILGGKLEIKAAAFSSDSRSVLSIMRNGMLCTLNVDQLNARKKDVLLKKNFSVYNACFSPDKKLLATYASYSTYMLSLWNITNTDVPTLFCTYKPGIKAAQFSEDGNLLLTISDDNMLTISSIAKDGLSDLFHYPAPVYEANFIDNCPFVVVYPIVDNDEYELKVLNPNTGELVFSENSYSGIEFVNVQFSREQQTFLVFFRDGRIFKKNVMGEALVPPFDARKKITSTTISPEGKLVQPQNNKHT